MNNEPNPPLELLEELLADQALFGLSEEQQLELDELLIGANGGAAESLERIAAAVQLAGLHQQSVLPSHLRQQLVRDGLELVTSQGDTAQTSQPPQTADANAMRPVHAFAARRELVAWIVAAAAILVSFFLANQFRQPAVAKQTPAELRSELLNDPQQVTTVNWAHGPNPTGENTAGDVVWSTQRQQGVMRFQKLPVNDPRKFQYQLWIFDSAQDERYPVDGGVFDIPAGADEVLVAIQAKLPIVGPTLFAITVEKPGGVVVSSRENLPRLAAVAR
jgi:hypothetical protein